MENLHCSRKKKKKSKEKEKEISISDRYKEHMGQLLLCFGGVLKPCLQN